MKITPVGLFPEDWEIIQLGTKASVLRGGSPRPIDSFLTNDPDGINWIKIGDVAVGAKYIKQTEEKIIPEGAVRSRKVYAGDFLLSNSMSFGRPYILQIDGCIHDGWLVIQEYYDTFETDYLYYALNSGYVLEQYKSLAAGSSVLNLNKDIVKRVNVAVPSRSEQKRIAEALSGIDNMIATLDEAIAKKQQIKEGLMQQLLTGKTRLPGFRGEWDEVTFKSIYKYAKEGGTPSTGVAEYYNPATVPFAKIEDLKDKYLTRVESYISESGVEHSSAWVIPVDSVILSNGATLGEVSINKIPTSTKQGILGIILKEQYSPEFVYYLFKGRVFRREMERVTTHGTMDCAYLKDLNTIPLTMPSLEEQEAIASVISSIDKEVYSLESLRDKYSLIKQGMMQELLTGTIRLI